MGLTPITSRDRREDAAARNPGDRFRELLLAHPQLEPIIADPSLDPVPDEPKQGRNASDAADLTIRRVIELETENATLRRAVTEHRDRTRLLSDAVFRATMDVNQKRAEQGNRVTVIEPAFTPDHRLYRRIDLEQSGLPTLAVVPPPAQRSRPPAPR